MTRKTIKLLNTQETVTLLTLHLGAPVGWAAWLADIRRTPREGVPVPSLHGLQLPPYAQHGLAALYRPRDVKVFIDANGPAFYVVDDHGELQYWRFRKARPAITPTVPATLLKRAA